MKSLEYLPRSSRYALPTLLAAGVLSGCATVPGADPRDPWEPYNRSMTKFNTAVDDAVMKPVATLYKTVTPQVVRTGFGNFFGNLGDVWSFVNNVLQAKPEGVLHSFWRVAINTTIGIGGVFDPASEMRLVRHREDFGQTLARWGAPAGPYVVLPLLGSSTLRDTVALPVDFYGQPLGHIDNIPVRNSLTALQAVETRSRLLNVTGVLEDAALDRYTFQRDAYLQKRRNDVYDGNPPQENADLPADEASVSEPPASTASAARAPASAQPGAEAPASAAAAAEPPASSASPSTPPSIEAPVSPAPPVEAADDVAPPPAKNTP